MSITDIFFNWKPIDVENCEYYYGSTNTIFILKNLHFSVWPGASYKIIDNYDKTNVLIKTTQIILYPGEMGTPYINWHDITFQTSGIYKIQIRNVNKNTIKTLIFTIS